MYRENVEQTNACMSALAHDRTNQNVSDPFLGAIYPSVRSVSREFGRKKNVGNDKKPGHSLWTIPGPSKFGDVNKALDRRNNDPFSNNNNEACAKSITTRKSGIQRTWCGERESFVDYLVEWSPWGHEELVIVIVIICSLLRSCTNTACLVQIQRHRTL